MNLRDAAQAALEAIRIFREWEMGQDYDSNRETVLARAFAAEELLAAALAEPVQEPVAWRTFEEIGINERIKELALHHFSVMPNDKELEDFAKHIARYCASTWNPMSKAVMIPQVPSAN